MAHRRTISAILGAQQIALSDPDRDAYWLLVFVAGAIAGGHAADLLKAVRGAWQDEWTRDASALPVSLGASAARGGALPSRAVGRLEP